MKNNTNAHLSSLNPHLRIGWLYPKLMSTYGDRGNILVLQKRCEWRGIKTEIVEIDQRTTAQELSSIDLLFGGGAQDREQGIVMQNLQDKKETIHELIEKNIPSLFVCGAPQLMGNYYEPAEGERIEGLGIFDMYTKHPGPKQDRLIGNVVGEITAKKMLEDVSYHTSLVGFENHGGRTYLGTNAKPFAKVYIGFGNNGEDKTEGIIYKNAIGSYLHGPLLPKNPQIADWLIATSLEVKYSHKITLEELDDTFEIHAKTVIAKRLGHEV